jgi:hypothetical protein
MDSSPDNGGTLWHCQTRRVRQARREGIRMKKSVVEPPQAGTPAQIWWIWAGQQRTPILATPKPSHVVGWEATSKACGVDVARLQGKSWMPHSSTDQVVNVGTTTCCASCSCSQHEHGWTRRQFNVLWGGELVVVRGRESRLHGEGVQQTRNCGVAISGDRQ